MIKLRKKEKLFVINKRPHPLAFWVNFFTQQETDERKCLSLRLNLFVLFMYRVKIFTVRTVKEEGKENGEGEVFTHIFGVCKCLTEKRKLWINFHLFPEKNCIHNKRWNDVDFIVFRYASQFHKYSPLSFTRLAFWNRSHEQTSALNFYCWIKWKSLSNNLPQIIVLLYVAETTTESQWNIRCIAKPNLLVSLVFDVKSFLRTFGNKIKSKPRIFVIVKALLVSKLFN